MPVPPASPVVSVSRNAHLQRVRAGDGAAGERLQQVLRSSARSEMSTEPWRRWRSQTRSVSKCSPSVVLTTSPESNSSIELARRTGRARRRRRQVGGDAVNLSDPAGGEPRVVAGYPPFAFSLPQCSARFQTPVVIVGG